jgi:EcsC family protein
MLGAMPPLHNSENGSPLKRFLRFGLLRGMRSVEIDPEDFRNYLARKHRLHVSDFRNMHQVPIERLDAIAKVMIRDAQRLALAEGAGFGLGGMITLVPDAGLLTIITLRLIQRLCLLYGFEATGPDENRELWLAAATATGIDFGKDLAEKQIIEKLAPRIAERLALKFGEEAAEKWVGRLIPLASSVVGGVLNFSFVRSWGRRVQRNLRARHLAERSVDIYAGSPKIVVSFPAIAQ